MKREIKFRAWHSERKEMYSGDGMQGIFINVESDDGTCSLDVTISNLQLEYELMQFTGLHDKNGKEIYEGDIVEYYNTLEPVRSKVEWGGQFEECGFVLTGITEFANKRIQYSNDQINKRWEDNLEILGNIYENPELLKQI